MRRGRAWTARMSGLVTGLVLAVSGCTGSGEPPGHGATTASATKDAAADAGSTTLIDGGADATDAASATREAAGATVAPGLAPAELVWAVETRVLSSPTYADEGVVLLYQQDGDEDMTLAAYDAATGEELWTQQASPSASPVADQPALVEADGRQLVMALAPMQDGWGTLVALDPAHGSRVARGPDPTFASTMPGSCDRGPTATCFSAFSQEQQDFVDVMATVDGSSIRVEEVDEASRDTDDETAGHEDKSWFGIRDDGSGDVSFTYHDQGRLAWEVPAEEVGHDVEEGDTPFGQWTSREDTVVSSVNWGTVEGAAQDVVPSVPVGELRTTAFAMADGEVLWARTGSMTCGGYHDDVIVLCEADEGELALTHGTGGEFTGAEATMIGVDPQTGDVLWSARITGEQWRAMEGLPGVLSHTGLMLSPADDQVLIDVATGEPAELTAEQVDYSCFDAGTWTYETPYDPQSPEPDDRLTRALSYACTVDGEPTQLTRWPEDRDLWGTEAGDLWLIARPDRVEAYRID